MTCHVELIVISFKGTFSAERRMITGHFCNCHYWGNSASPVYPPALPTAAMPHLAGCPLCH